MSIGARTAADAEAICEAMSRPKVKRRFVAIKTVEQQARQMLIGVRENLLKRRTQVSNTIRGLTGPSSGLWRPKVWRSSSGSSSLSNRTGRFPRWCGGCLRRWSGNIATSRPRSGRSRPD